MINTSKPGAPSIVNTVKASFAVLWSTITTTWATETSTWDATGSLITNIARATSSMTNTPKP